jgi:ABC-type branched-subunit amino acid transport system ATPase component
MATAISVRGLRKSYGTLNALAGIDLDIEAGEVFALLGPNGAGKTTMVEILEGYRDRSGGDVLVLGQDPRNPTGAWKARIGIVLQSSNVFDALTVEELVRHFAAFYSHPMPVDRAIGLVGLGSRRGVRCKSLSGGQKRRVDLALGLIGDPELIFLDEPTTGFDPAARRQASRHSAWPGVGREVVGVRLGVRPRGLFVLAPRDRLHAPHPRRLLGGRSHPAALSHAPVHLRGVLQVRASARLAPGHRLALPAPLDGAGLPLRLPARLGRGRRLTAASGIWIGLR